MFLILPHNVHSVYSTLYWSQQQQQTLHNCKMLRFMLNFYILCMCIFMSLWNDSLTHHLFLPLLAAFWFGNQFNWFSAWSAAQPCHCNSKSGVVRQGSKTEWRPSGTPWAHAFEDSFAHFYPGSFRIANRHSSLLQHRQKGAQGASKLGAS